MIDWRVANRFLLIAAAVLLVAWGVRALWIGGTPGGPDVVIALAVATIGVTAIARRDPRT